MMEVFVKIVILDLDFYIDGIVLNLMDTIEQFVNLLVILVIKNR